LRTLSYGILFLAAAAIGARASQPPAQADPAAAIRVGSELDFHPYAFIELNELVARTVEDNRSLFENAGVSLAWAPSGTTVAVFADRTRVSQIVGNLAAAPAVVQPHGAGSGLRTG